MPPRYPPATSGLCRTLATLSRKTWRVIGIGHHAQFSLGEESITDYVLLDIKLRHPGTVHIQKFNRRVEGATTGADWEWWFGAAGLWFGMRVQAKRLNPRRMEYDYLDHTNPRTGERQVDMLVRDAAAHGLFPTYCFYNFWQASPPPSPWACSCCNPFDEHLGCTLADARGVNAILRAGSKRYADACLIARPWMCLACQSLAPSQNTSLPNRVRMAASDLAESAICYLAKRAETGFVDPVPDTNWEPPMPRQNLPNYVQRIRESLLSEQPFAGAENDELGLRIDGLMLVEEEPPSEAY